MRCSENSKRSAFGRVTDGFNVVPIRIESECGVVRRVIMRAKTRQAIVSSPCTDSSSMKRVDVGPTPRPQSDVQQSDRSPLFCQPKPRPIVAITRNPDTTRLFFGNVKQPANTQGRKCLIVKRCGSHKVGNAKSDVINHLPTFDQRDTRRYLGG